VAATVERCPTGALRYERLDGAGDEVPHRPTLVLPVQDGPLLMVGDLDVKTPDGTEIAREARLALCRCGMTHNQPFCDNSHRRRHWESGPTHSPNVAPPPPREDSGAARGGREAPRRLSRTRTRPGRTRTADGRGADQVRHLDDPGRDGSGVDDRPDHRP
jgi:CDGSH-type Zn-finger protein